MIDDTRSQASRRTDEMPPHDAANTKQQQTVFVVRGWFMIKLNIPVTFTFTAPSSSLPAKLYDRNNDLTVHSEATFICCFVVII